MAKKDTLSLQVAALGAVEGRNIGEVSESLGLDPRLVAMSLGVGSGFGGGGKVVGVELPGDNLSAEDEAELKLCKGVIKQLMVGAEDEGVRLKAAIWSVDELKGRHDLGREVLRSSTIGELNKMIGAATAEMFKGVGAGRVEGVEG